MSWAKQSDDTKRMLYSWANRIIVVDKWLEEEVLNELEKWPVGKNADDVVLIPIGQDKWGQSMHPDLVPLATKLLNDAGFHSHKSFEAIMAKYAEKAAKYEQRRTG